MTAPMAVAPAVYGPARRSYVDHFGFAEPPFLTSADPRFLFRSAPFTRALDSVLDAIGRDDRLIVVTGSRGIGKTTLCLELEQTLPATAMVSVDVSHRPSLLQCVQAQRRGVCILDIAHQFDEAFLHDLLPARRNSDVQIVLVGDPQLECLIEEAGLQCEYAIVRLAPLGRYDVEQYVARRMWLATGGAAPAVRFSARAVQGLAAATGGNPRLVNAVCTRALARAAGRGTSRIGNRLVSEAAQDLSLAVPRRIAGRPYVWAALWLALAAGVSGTAWLQRGQTNAAAATTTLDRAEPARPAPAVADDGASDLFTTRTLQRAEDLAAKPDVRGLLQLREEVDRTAPSAIELVNQLERLTNDARERQLHLDREQLLNDRKAR